MLVHQFRCPLADHDAGGVQLAVEIDGENRGIGHAQARQPAHPEVRIDDGVGAAAHRAGPGRVKDGVGGPPDEVRDLLLAMNVRFGLLYGAYDLIVTPDGQYVFLEVNSVGQWLWLERATGLPISEALGKLLIKLATE